MAAEEEEDEEQRQEEGEEEVEEVIVCQMLFPPVRYLDLASRSTQSALAYLRLTVLPAEAGSISGPAAEWM